MRSFLALALGCLPSVLAGPLAPRDDRFEWGVVGDSWASGVAYLPTNEYDNNNGDCLRINQAYAALMEKDKTWTTQDQNLHFVACSGSKLLDMTQGRGHDQRGNDAGFFDIATSCIFHQNINLTYGPDYADDRKGIGLCAQAMKKSRDYIFAPNHDPKGLSLGRDLIETMEDILDSDSTKIREGFTLYVTGYAHFFNLDNDEWCNSASFGAFPGNKPKLSHVLRQDINELTTGLNNKIQEIVGLHANAKYISITAGFDGHRFCETRHNLNDQYYSSDVWLWNLIAPGAGIDGLASVADPGEQGGKIWEGWIQRPFHPKQAGHQVFADEIIAKMREDKIPGVKPEKHGSSLPPPGSSGSPAPMNSAAIPPPPPPHPPSSPPSTIAPPAPKPTCPKSKFYGSDTTCGKGECTKGGGKCQCIQAGYNTVSDTQACVCQC